MNNSSVRNLRKPLALIIGAGLSMFAAQAAFAQAADASTTDQSVKLDKFVVTGSNIPTTETAVEAGTFPVVILDRKAIDQTGSITAAAKHLDMSYRRAWQLVESLNGAFLEPVISTAIGGSRGGVGGLLHLLRCPQHGRGACIYRAFGCGCGGFSHRHALIAS